MHNIWSQFTSLKSKYQIIMQVGSHIEYNDPTPSPNFDFPMFEAEEENDDE